MIMRDWFAAAAIFLTIACAPATEAEGDATAETSLQIETLASGLALPWSMAFLPGGEILVVEKAGALRIVRNGALAPEPVAGLPDDVYINVDSGYHDIVLDPDFEQNRRVFIAYASGDEEANALAIFRARLQGDALVGGEVIYRVPFEKAGPSHPGGRILFLPDKTFLVSVGDGYDYMEAAQDLRSPLGKIIRLDRDGAPPEDNPFAGRTDALPEIWSYGHRNVQGLALDSQTGEIWAHEHGPRGGDEINRLEPGANYGWPVVTNGIDYDGTLVSERAHAPGIESPLIVWAPSIAPSGLAVYRGARFPDWDGKLLLGALAARALIVAQTDNEGRAIRETARFLAERTTRLRDVRQGPDGAVYILTDEGDGKLWRVTPGAGDE